MSYTAEVAAAIKQTNVVAARLREALLAIQKHRAPDPFNWMRVLS